MVEWPNWWSWELEMLVHVQIRMVDREFNEIDLRLMLEDATGYHPDVVDGRWVIECGSGNRPWEVIVQPLPDERRLLVITAYPAP
jgi:hypothetical protein